ncbi:hypothetical protein MNBD_GAMMA01-2170 [hydrothermal vent metagenome]|uniref:Right handed beta helix domain-containing protein n=1 Tax=hydrothermal vent metagenome TaxID=652676 RepID=A0A3B0W370_9ZZZZ
MSQQLTNRNNIMKTFKTTLSTIIFFLFIGISSISAQVNSSNSFEAQEWKLADGNFIPAKMPMYLVYPRPDSETGASARHKFAHPNMRYEIPVGVQGGAWPFKYELLQAPSGATIGEVYGDDDYGSISWLAPNSGTFLFEVKVTDQELNVVNATWQVTIDASMFVFIEDGYTGTKVGTINQPLEDIADWYLGDRNDATYLNKIIVLRNGNYNLIGDSSANGNVRLDADTKTGSIIAYPSEIPIVDCSTAKIFTDNISMKDIFIAGIRWENGRQDVNNAHFFWAVGDVSRATWWRNHFHNLGKGTVGNDNTAGVFVSSTLNIKENILYKENNHTEFYNQGYNGGYLVIYWSNYVLIEQNTASDSEVAYGFFAKGTRAYCTIRANTAVDNVQGIQIRVQNGAEAGALPHDHEVGWNNIKVPDNNTNGIGLQMSASTFYLGQTYSNHVYRNTFVGHSAWVRFLGAENYKVDGNVVVATGNLPRWNTDIMDELIVSNLTTDGTEDFVDVNGKLKGVYRSMYLGTHGHEVGENATTDLIFLDGFE